MSLKSVLAYEPSRENLNPLPLSMHLIFNRFSSVTATKVLTGSNHVLQINYKNYSNYTLFLGKILLDIVENEEIRKYNSSKHLGSVLESDRKASVN